MGPQQFRNSLLLSKTVTSGSSSMSQQPPCTVEVINIKTQLRYEVRMLEALNPAEAAQGRGPQPKQQLGSFISFCPKVFEASEALLVRTSLKGGEAHWFRACVILLLLSLGSLLD